MEELRARFGRALRDQNFWSLMEELDELSPSGETPDSVVAFPSDRTDETPARPTGSKGQLITGRFPRKNER